MKPFQERNLVVIGTVGLAVTAVVLVGALNYKSLIPQGTEYSAYFAEAGGLIADSDVQVSGFPVGKVESVELDGPRVLVTFTIDDGIRIGDRTEAAVKTQSLLGAKLLEITPRGDGQLDGPIPLDRTTPAYQLPDAIGDLTTAISGLDTQQLSDSLAVVAETLGDTPPDVRAAVEGVGRVSQTLNERDAQLRSLLFNADKATDVLAERSDQIVSLVRDTNSLLAALRSQNAALDQISLNVSMLAQELKGFIDENRTQLQPALEKLNGVLQIVDNHREDVGKILKGFVQYAQSLGESVSSGPFFKAYVANLFPGQFVQPFIDVAFSDLGLDPAVLLPTEISDPQVGQRGTPALPPPFPRTGQGGDPRLTILDSITGNPGERACPGVLGPASPGPGCYPLQPEPPRPPPGGPPPGPPAPGPAELESTATPPLPLVEPAPGQQVPPLNPPTPETAPPGPPTVGPGAPGASGPPPPGNRPPPPPGFVPPPQPPAPPPPLLPEGGQ